MKELPLKTVKTIALCLSLLLPLIAVGQSPQSPSSQPDTVGLPDLVVNSNLLGEQWVVRDEQLDATLCCVEEGGVTPGLRTVVRFTVETPNIGNADIVVGDPNAHVAAGDGLFEFATCHHHYHFRHYAKYELIRLDADGNEIGAPVIAAKRGFCMIDVAPFNSAA